MGRTTPCGRCRGSSRVLGTGTIAEHDASPQEHSLPRRPSAARTTAAGGTRGVSIAASVVQFAIVGVAALMLVAIVAGSRVRDSSTNESIRDASELATLLAGQLVTPRVTPALLAGDPEAIAAMDAVIHDIVDAGPVHRVKIWTPDGRIVYSDEPRLIGRSYPLDEEIGKAVLTGEPVIGYTHGDEPENEFDEVSERQLDVYLPFRAPNGELLIYEHYQHNSAVDAGAAKVSAAFSPLVIRSLIALELLQLPLAWWLAMRVRAAQRQKVVLLQSALDASDIERRRIAQDLHDGVVQDLAGVSYTIDAVRHDPLVQSSPSMTRTLDRVVDEAQRSIRGLRTLLVDIYPPSLEEGDLAGALGDLLAPFEARGVHTEFRDLATGTMSSVAHSLIYRTSREALRNVEEHADASAVRLTLTDHGPGSVRLEIVDDGRGFDPDELEARQAAGHFGVRLLGDVATAAGGQLTIDSAPGRGTRLRLVVPR